MVTNVRSHNLSGNIYCEDYGGIVRETRQCNLCEEVYSVVGKEPRKCHVNFCPKWEAKEIIVRKLGLIIHNFNM